MLINVALVVYMAHTSLMKLHIPISKTSQHYQQLVFMYVSQFRHVCVSISLTSLCVRHSWLWAHCRHDWLWLWRRDDTSLRLTIWSSTAVYFCCFQKTVFCSPASWFSLTLLLLRATARIFHEGLTLVFSHVFSISVSCSWGLWNIALIVSSSPTLKPSWSPSRYHFADTSTTSSSTHGRSAGVNLLSEQDNSRELI